MPITSKMIQSFTGLKPNTLTYYIKEGAIIPDVLDESRQGSQKLFSSTNVIEAAIIQFLIMFNIPRRDIVSLLKSLRIQNDRQHLDPVRILTKDKVTALLFYPSGDDIHYRVIELADNKIPENEGFMFINLSVFAKKYGYVEQRVNTAVKILEELGKEEFIKQYLNGLGLDENGA